MSTLVYLNQTERITVTFYSWPSDDDPAIPEDPETVEVRIYNTDTVLDTLLSTDVPEAGASTGQFVYEWTPTDVGNFNVQFFATFSDDSTNPVNNFFTAYEAVTAPEGSTLQADQTIMYTGVLDPMYLDPEEITLIYPDADTVTIAELIHQYSVEVESMLKLDDDEVPPFLAIEYIKAAVCCALSRTFDEISAGNSFSFELGDLKVSNSAYPKSVVSRGTATSWCELAAALRNELVANNVGMKKLSKGKGGGDCPNLIPSRRLRHHDTPSTIYEYSDSSSNPPLNQF